MKKNFFLKFEESMSRYSKREKTGTYISVVLSHLLEIDKKLATEIFALFNIIREDTDSFAANKFYKKTANKRREADIEITDAAGKLKLLVEIKFDDSFRKNQLQEYLKMNCPVLIITKNLLTSTEKKLIEKNSQVIHIFFYELFKIAEQSKLEITNQFCEYLKEAGVTMFHSKMNYKDVEFYMSRILANRSKDGRKSKERFKNPGKFLSQIGDNMSLVGENLSFMSGIQGSMWFFQDFAVSAKKNITPLLRERMLAGEEIYFEKSEFDSSKGQNRAFFCFAYSLNKSECEIGYSTLRTENKISISRYVNIRLGFAEIYLEEKVKLNNGFFQFEHTAGDETEKFRQLLLRYHKTWFSIKKSKTSFVKWHQDEYKKDYLNFIKPISAKRKKIIVNVASENPDFEMLLGKDIDDQFYKRSKSNERKYLIDIWNEDLNKAYHNYLVTFPKNKKLMDKMIRR